MNISGGTMVTSILILLMGAPLALAQKEAIPRHQAFQEKADTYLVKVEEVRPYFDITAEGISTYRSQEDKASGAVEMRLYWEELDTFRKLVKVAHRKLCQAIMLEKKDRRWSAAFEENLPEPGAPWKSVDGSLAGLRVAIDPGHIGGSMANAIAEEKYIKIRAAAVPGRTRDITFNEGNLNLGTARLLRDKLEKEGATVMLTRPEPGRTALGLDFGPWLNIGYLKDFEIHAEAENWPEEKRAEWLETATDSDKWKTLLRKRDFEERVRLIEQFQPHLTIFIHYNVRNAERDDQNYVATTDKNFNMAFIAGSFGAANEVGRPEDRFEFLRMLATDDIENSKQLSTEVVKAFTVHTGVQPVMQDKGIRYLERWSMKAAPGVYSRNLALTRLVHGTICFGETLCQNHIEEALKLEKKDLRIGNLETSRRIEAVADAYFEGIKRYALKNR